MCIVLNPANHPDGLTNRECMHIDFAMIDVAVRYCFCQIGTKAKAQEWKETMLNTWEKKFGIRGWLFE
jgi:hypothetical protein